MKDIKNETTKQFIENRINELVNYSLPLTSLREIDSFIDDELDAIKENILERISQIKKELYNKIENVNNENLTTINNLNIKINDYENDFKTLDNLKTMRRKKNNKGNFERFFK